MSKDIAEVRRCLRSLAMPFFHHEAVKQALLVALDDPAKQQPVLEMLGQLADSSDISGSQMLRVRHCRCGVKPGCCACSLRLELNQTGSVLLLQTSGMATLTTSCPAGFPARERQPGGHLSGHPQCRGALRHAGGSCKGAGLAGRQLCGCRQDYGMLSTPCLHAAALFLPWLLSLGSVQLFVCRR